MSDKSGVEDEGRDVSSNSSGVTPSGGTVLGRYDARKIGQLFDDAGIYAALTRRGFSDFEVAIDRVKSGLPHLHLYARKETEQCALLDACIMESVVQAEFFRERGCPMEGPLDVVSLYWLREEDPTARFSSERPPLPLQRYPGLGILRAAFQVIVRMARERGKDGIACVPKFFHDAAIFFRSRLFLFLDGSEQGRFEALLHSFGTLPLGTASLLLASDGVKDCEGQVTRWGLSPQMFPISDRLRDYFNSAPYAAAVASAFERSRFTWDSEALVQARELARRSSLRMDPRDRSPRAHDRTETTAPTSRALPSSTRR